MTRRSFLGLLGCGGCAAASLGFGLLRMRGRKGFDFGDNTLVAYFADGTEWTSRERGVKPLVDAIDGMRERFAGAKCYDRVVGRAAAFLYAKLGVSYVFAPVMAKGAVAILKRHGIEPSFDLEVPGIRNRANDGPCPMEQAVCEIADTDVDAAVAAIRTQMERLRQSTMTGQNLV